MCVYVSVCVCVCVCVCVTSPGAGWKVTGIALGSIGAIHNSHSMNIGSTRTKYVYGNFGRETTKCTVMHSVYIWFWPTLLGMEYHGSDEAIQQFYCSWVVLEHSLSSVQAS